MKSTLLFCLFFSVSICCFSQKHTLTGKVYYEDNVLLPFANVSIKNSSLKKTTNLQGKFSLSVQPKDTLQISFIGYKTKELVVGNQKEITVTLELKNNSTHSPKIIRLEKAIETQKIRCNSN